MIPAFVPAQSFTAPEIHWLTLAPMLIVFGGALIGVLIEAFAPRARRHELEVPLTMATLVAALVVLIGFTRGAQRSTIGGAVVVDGVALGLQGLQQAVAARQGHAGGLGAGRPAGHGGADGLGQIVDRGGHGWCSRSGKKRNGVCDFRDLVDLKKIHWSTI